MRIGIPEMIIVIGIVFVILALAAVVALSVLIRARGDKKKPLPSPRQDALAILKERYARGEITREQFESMRRDLKS